MGLYDKLIQLMNTIDKRKGIKLNPDELADLLNLYIEKAFVSPFEHRKDAIHLIEKFPQKVPRKARKLPRFSGSEQRRRAAQSAAVREMVVRHVIAANTQLDEYKKEDPNVSYDREYQRLFRNSVPGVELTDEEQARLDMSNKEVAFLFNNNTDWGAQADQLAERLVNDPAETAEFRVKYDAYTGKPLTKDDILDAWARRRAAIVMARYRESVEAMNGVAEASSSSLSPQELAANFWKIKEASQVLAVLKNMVRNGQNPKMPVTYTEAELAEIGDPTRFENVAGAAICKFNLIANPMYSYLDIDALKDYDFNQYTGVGNAYQELMERRQLPEGLDMEMPQFDSAKLEEAVIEEFIAKHQNAHTAEVLRQLLYAPTIAQDGKERKNLPGEGSIRSGFDLFLSDYQFYYSNEIKPLADKTDEYLKIFGLPVRYLSRYPEMTQDVTFFAEENTPQDLTFASSTVELDSDNFLAKGTPVAYQLHGRTVVLSQKEDGKIGVDNLTYENPEALFNFALKHQQQTFVSQLHDSDSRFVKSSPAFRDMKRSLEAIGNMQKLQPGQDVAEAEAHFRKLLEDTEKYLIYKKDAGLLHEGGRDGEAVADDDRSDYERKRLEVARKIRAFAQTKLKELDLIRQAQDTLSSFTRMENGVRVPVDEQTRDHLISRTDLPSRLRTQIRNAPAQPQPAVEPAQENEHAQVQPAAEGDELDRRYGHADAQVASFAQSHIVNAIRNHRTSGEAFSPEECRFVLSSALLYHMLCREAGEHTAEAAGSLTDMLKHHPNIFTTLQQKLMQSGMINAYLKGVDGMPISTQVMDVLLEQTQNTPLASIDLSMDVLTADECTKLLTNEILDIMLRQERAANQTDRPGVLETMLCSDKKHAEMIADRIKESVAMKEMISGATVDGQVSFLNVSSLLKRVNEPDFFNEKRFLRSDDIYALISRFVYDSAEGLNNEEGLKYEDEYIGNMLNQIKNSPYYEGILKEIRHSEMFHTMTEKAGIGEDQELSLKELTGLMAQMPAVEEILTIPLLSTEYCVKALAEDALNRVIAVEKNRRGEQNAFSQPLIHLLKIDPDGRNKLIDNLIHSTGKDSLSPGVQLMQTDKKVPAISLSSMAILTSNVPTWALDTMFDESILDEDMCCKLLSDYMLDSMIELHHSTQGKAGDLEKMKAAEPENYAQLRSKLAKTSNVREVFYKAANVNKFDVDGAKQSIEDLSKMFQRVKDPQFCRKALERAHAAMEAEKRDKNQVHTNKVKPAMKRK